MAAHCGSEVRNDGPLPPLCGGGVGAVTPLPLLRPLHPLRLELERASDLVLEPTLPQVIEQPGGCRLFL
jgi:hypothetical protein